MLAVLIGYPACGPPALPPSSQWKGRRTLKTEHKDAHRVRIVRRKEPAIMLDISKVKKRNDRSKQRPQQQARPGVHDSVVTSVTEPDGYTPGTAIEIKYRLTDSAGRVSSHREIFITGGKRIPDRTYDFEDYLDANGIEYYSDFVGCTERLTMVYNGLYLNIANREFVSKPPAVGGSSNVSGT